MDCNGPYELGISCKRWSLASAEYVPAFCTHRPSLLPMDYLVRSLEVIVRMLPRGVASALLKLTELDDLEEVKVVTRFP